MSDVIRVSGMELYAYGGVSESERDVGQRYRLDLELRLDLTRAGETDSLEDTVSYAEACRLAERALRAAPFRLIEHAAARIAHALLHDLAVDGVAVRLAKLMPPIDGVVAEAAVEISRERLDGDRTH